MKALYVLTLLCLTVTGTALATGSAPETTTDVNYIDVADNSLVKHMNAMKASPETHAKAAQYWNPNEKERNHAISRIKDYHHKKMSNSTEKTLLDIDEVFLWLNVVQLVWSIPTILEDIAGLGFALVPDLAIVWILLDILAVFFNVIEDILFPITILVDFLWILSIITFPYEVVMLYFLITNYGPYSLVQKKSKNVCNSNHHTKAKVESLWAKKDYAGIGKELCTMPKLLNKKKTTNAQKKQENKETGKHAQITLHKMCGEVVKATHESTNDLVKGLDLRGFDSSSSYCDNKLVSSYSL